MLDRYGFSRAFMFCMDEHDREPAFTVPNDRTLAHAERSAGKLIPFVRLDLTEQPARGGTALPRPRRAGASSSTRERRRSPSTTSGCRPSSSSRSSDRVPILIHGGRGLPPIAEHLETLVRRYEGVRLIVAHAGIADMAGLAGPPRRDPGSLLRHVGLERRRPARPLPPGRARAGRLRVRLPVRAAAELAARWRFARRSSPGSTTSSCAAMLGGNARRISPGEDRSSRSRRRGRDVARPAAHVRADPPVHLDGGAAALASPARRDRRARARRERLARARTATSRRPSASRSCS